MLKLFTKNRISQLPSIPKNPTEQAIKSSKKLSPYAYYYLELINIESKLPVSFTKKSENPYGMFAIKSNAPYSTPYTQGNIKMQQQILANIKTFLILKSKKVRHYAIPS